MNSKNKGKCDPHRLLLNNTDKVDLKTKDDNMFLYQTLAVTIPGEI